MSSFILVLSVFEALQTNYSRDSGTFILFEIKKYTQEMPTSHIVLIGNRLENLIKIIHTPTMDMLQDFEIVR